MRDAFVRLLLTAGLSAVGLTLSPAGGGVALAHPTANFDWTPKPVVAGKPVRLQSTSVPHDEFTPIVKYTWSLGGTRQCIETVIGGSPTCTTTAPAPGPWNVTLVVDDAGMENGSITKTISVQAPPLPPPPPPPPPNQPPRAAFAALPGSPRVGQEVTFVSYSDDRDGNVTSQTWDLDGDGAFDDAAGAVVTRRYAVPGPKKVTLLVRDDRGATSTMSLTVQVAAQSGSSTLAPQPLVSGPAPLPKLLSPFPIVRLVGSAAWSGTSIELLTVRAPKGARALVRCRSEDCPVKRIRKTARRKRLRFKAAERIMPTGAVLEVLVRRGDRIGKFTRFRFRRSRRPVRTDGCLWPHTKKMAPCPET